MKKSYFSSVYYPEYAEEIKSGNSRDSWFSLYSSYVSVFLFRKKRKARRKLLSRR